MTDPPTTRVIWYSDTEVTRRVTEPTRLGPDDAGASEELEASFSVARGSCEDASLSVLALVNEAEDKGSDVVSPSAGGCGARLGLGAGVSEDDGSTSEDEEGAGAACCVVPGGGEGSSVVEGGGGACCVVPGEG
jgi:hypothetical protein